MYKLRDPKDADSFVRRMTHAIDNKQPVTITYRKPVDGGGYQITVRTIEPYGIDVIKGHPILLTMDRESQAPRTWRMERILTYTVHHGHRTMKQGA